MFHVGIEIPYLDIIRMPLYFIISGLFFKEYSGFIDFSLRKINKILIPFIVFYTIGYACYYAIRYLSPESNLIDNGILDIFTRSHHVFNTPVWFLLSLFWVSLLFYLCKLISKNVKHESMTLAIVVMLFASFGQIMSCCGVRTPLFIDTSLSALPFYYIGYLLKKSNFLLPTKSDKYNWPLFVILIVITIGITEILSLYVDVQYNHIPIVCYAVSTTGVLSVLLACKIFGYIKIVSYFGRYSIIILVTHNLVYRFLKLIFQRLSYTPNYFEWIQFIFVVSVSLLIIPFCIKFLPKITAQKDLIKNIYSK